MGGARRKGVSPATLPNSEEESELNCRDLNSLRCLLICKREANAREKSDDSRLNSAQKCGFKREFDPAMNTGSRLDKFD